MATLDNLLKLIGTPRDGALLRFSIGNELVKLGDYAHATVQLRAALAITPDFSAAWKLLGKALMETGNDAEALAAYRQGIDVAEARGDVQAAKEMKVFARRIERRSLSG